MCKLRHLVFRFIVWVVRLAHARSFRFEIAIATIISFIAAALASTQYFCYTALVSGGVVLILPVSRFGQIAIVAFC